MLIFGYLNKIWDSVSGNFLTDNHLQISYDFIIVVTAVFKSDVRVNAFSFDVVRVAHHGRFSY